MQFVAQQNQVLHKTQSLTSINNLPIENAWDAYKKERQRIQAEKKQEKDTAKEQEEQRLRASIFNATKSKPQRKNGDEDIQIIEDSPQQKPKQKINEFQIPAYEAKIDK